MRGGPSGAALYGADRGPSDVGDPPKGRPPRKWPSTLGEPLAQRLTVNR
jgi:hypothetical protein